MDHICTCGNCDPDLMPPSERLGPTHYDTNSAETNGLRGQVILTVDGVEVQEEAFNFVVGDDGWVLAFNKDSTKSKPSGFHFCRTCDTRGNRWPTGPPPTDLTSEEEERLSQRFVCRRRLVGVVEMRPKATV